MGNSSAIVFLTYFLDEDVCARLLRLHEQASPVGDVFIFYDSRGTVAESRIPPAVRNRLSFDREEWIRHKSPTRFHRTFIPGNTDFQFINFRMQRPDYEYYWFIEYDVEFSANWSTFFDFYRSASEDFLSTTIYSCNETPDWTLWKSLSPPAGVTLSRDQMLRAFMPIVRFSGQAIDVWRECAESGWTGHLEVAVPTALSYKGLRLRDIGGRGRYVADGDEDRWYRNTASDNDLGPGTFIFRPHFKSIGSEAGKLWHPVKGSTPALWETKDAARGSELFAKARQLLRNRLFPHQSRNK